MTGITKTTYIDNFESGVKNTIEIGVKGKKAFIEHKTGRVINDENIRDLEKYQAFKMAMRIALSYNQSPWKEFYEKHLSKGVDLK